MSSLSRHIYEAAVNMYLTSMCSLLGKISDLGKIRYMLGITLWKHQILQTRASLFEVVGVRRSLPQCSNEKKLLRNVKQMHKPQT